MSSSYNGYSFEQLESRLLRMLDDLCYRMDNEGRPINPALAAMDGTLEIDGLAADSAQIDQCYAG